MHRCLTITINHLKTIIILTILTFKNNFMNTNLKNKLNFNFYLILFFVVMFITVLIVTLLFKETTTVANPILLILCFIGLFAAKKQ